MATGNVKQFLYTFCGKSQVQPAYTYESEETGFYCEVGEITAKFVVLLVLVAVLMGKSWNMYAILDLP